MKKIFVNILRETVKISNSDSYLEYPLSFAISNGIITRELIEALHPNYSFMTLGECGDISLESINKNKK